MMKVKVECSHCKSLFLKDKYKAATCLKKNKPMFCSKECVYTHKSNTMTKPDYHVVWKYQLGWYIRISGKYIPYTWYLFSLHYPDFFKDKDKSKYTIFIKNQEKRALYLNKSEHYYNNLVVLDLECILKKDFLKILDSNKEKRYKAISEAHMQKAVKDAESILRLYNDYKKIEELIELKSNLLIKPATNIITSEYVSRLTEINSLKSELVNISKLINTYQRSKNAKYFNSLPNDIFKRIIKF